MPMQMSPLNAGYVGVTRRIAIQAIKRIIPQLDLRPDTVIYTKGLEDNMLTWNSEKNTLVPIRHDANEDSARFGEYDKIEVEFKEEIMDEGLARNIHMIGDLPPIFADPVLGIKLYSQYVQAKITMNFTFSAVSHEQAQNVQAKILRLLSGHRHLTMSEIQYFVLPSDDTMSLLKDLYQLKANRDPNKESFYDWMNRCSYDHCYTELKTRAGLGGTMAFREKQHNVLLLLMETNEPENQKKERGASTEMTFEVQFYYESPFQTTTEFPIQVYNQFVPAKWIDGLREHYPHSEPRITYDAFQKANNVIVEMWDYQGSTVKENFGLRYPNWDSWMKKPSNPGNDVVLTRLIQLNDDIMRVNPLTGYTQMDSMDAIESTVMKFGWGMKRWLKDHHQQILYAPKTILHFNLYQGNDRVDTTNINVTPDIGIYTNYKLEWWQQWHLQIEQPRDYLGVEREVMEDLMRYPDTLSEIYTHRETNKGNLMPNTIPELCNWYMKLLPYDQTGMWLPIYRCLMLNLPLDNLPYGRHIDKYFYQWLGETFKDMKDETEARSNWYHLKDAKLRHGTLLEFQQALYLWLKAHHDNPDLVMGLFFGRTNFNKVMAYLSYGLDPGQEVSIETGIHRTVMKGYVSARRGER